MNVVKIAILGCLIALSAACSNNAVMTDAPPANGDQYLDYKLGSGDQIVVNVWRNEELSLAVPVRPDGKISLPLVGDVEAAGKSASELADEVKDKLVNFIRNPQVTVIVTDAVSSDYQRRVRVTGAVENPISVPFRQGMTVLDLVLETGGVSDFAMPNRTVLYRKSGSGVEAYSVRLGDILNKGRLTTNYELAPSDIISVPERAL